MYQAWFQYEKEALSIDMGQDGSLHIKFCNTVWEVEERKRKGIIWKRTTDGVDDNRPEKAQKVEARETQSCIRREFRGIFGSRKSTRVHSQMRSPKNGTRIRASLV